MYTTVKHPIGNRLARFIQGLDRLRELVILVMESGFLNGTSLLSHAQTLELLCMPRRRSGSVFKTFDDQSMCLSTVMSLRHLGIYIGSLTCRTSNGGTTYSKAELAKISVSPELHLHLRRLG